VVVAKSFARIFYRNGFNMGLVLLEVGDDVAKLRDGDKLEVDTEAGKIKNLTTGETIICAKVPTFMQELLDAGGLVPYVKKRLADRQ
jgi:3-isopropylmalate/(R)-2-methylmalate dehydratase small subunit